MNNIVINGIGLSGGGLILLENYLKLFENEEIHFTVFSEKKILKTKNANLIVKKYFSSFIGRFFFITIGFWVYYKLNKNSINSILSFINLGFPLIKNINQVIYYHQPIPLLKNNWSFLKKEERKLWFYQKIFPIIIRICNKKQFYYVAQTKWVANSLARKFGYKNIIVEHPTIQKINKKKINKNICPENQIVNFIYPSGYTTYKNHIEIINAIEYIHKNYFDKLENIQITFTLQNKHILNDLVKKKNLDKYFNFIGHRPILDIYKFYSRGYILLFPSKIETFGLPLLEAAQFGCQIISGDTPFANEILCDYNFFKCNFDNPKEWSTSIIKVMEDPKNISSVNYINKNIPWKKMNARLFKY